ncbi:GNAT family N-acetyltransferase [Nesterenkonia jeotgali]|uniref:N-acetyltransferase domain-containing protein n=1 Tax=Nesterenkonia jeotgali TaxID=317018 RepID=A0A0W8IJH8_9MICC|nr:GNAT family N-acetyltransferase [Nesterenkonia jeotgali]KUG60223.1 hypothetical protein AVL63_07340 [Nesterenkonia jeotgali]
MDPTPVTLSEAARSRTVSAWVSALGGSPQDIAKNEWLFVERADLSAVVAAQVDGFGVLAAPGAALDLIRDAPPRTLLDADALASLLPAGADPIGSADLLFAEHSPRLGPLHAAAAGPGDAAAVRTQVRPAEWEESGVDQAKRLWTALTPEGTPAAVAGFQPWHSELAQIAVLAGRGHRGSGFAYAAAALAIQEALAEGLVAQWRSRQGNEASLGLAGRLGFTQLGVQAAVRLRS